MLINASVHFALSLKDSKELTKIFKACWPIFGGLKVAHDTPILM